MLDFGLFMELVSFVFRHLSRYCIVFFPFDGFLFLSNVGGGVIPYLDIIPRYLNIPVDTYIHSGYLLVDLGMTGYEPLFTLPAKHTRLFLLPRSLPNLKATKTTSRVPPMPKLGIE